jgi:hypothetical protein
MNPIVVIGAGGSGKWIATDVKLAAIDLNNRRLLREHGEAARQRPDWDRLPPEIRVLAVDVASSEQQPVVRRDAQHAHFSLDYTASSAEFVDISAEPGTAIEAISSGKSGDFPRISAWLSKRDAACYDIRRLPTINSHGAGQLRQLGRLSLFSALQDPQEQNLPERIRSVLQDVNQARTNNAKVTIFICGSLAGGTGSGTLWDVAALARFHADEVLGDQHDLVGCIVLPTAFRRIARSGGEEKARMAANTYAGLRELARLMSSENNTEFAYNQHLEMTLREPIFSVAYLVEGSRPNGYDLAGEEPRFGTYPTIADTILLHSMTTVDMSQVRTEMSLHPEGVFSVAGAVQWVLPVEDIIYEAGHHLSRLSIECLLWGRQATGVVPPPQSMREAADGAEPARDRFLRANADGSSPLVRFTDSFLVQQKAIGLSTSLMYQQLQFNDQNRDRSLPVLVLAEQVELGPRIGRGDPVALKQQVEQIVARHLGGRTDTAPERKSVHTVLNHYRTLHGRVFPEYLRDAVQAVLNSTATEAGMSVRPGGLLHAEAFLDAVRERLEAFRRRFTEVYDTQQRVEGNNVTRLERAKQELSRAQEAMLKDQGSWGGRGRQHEYVRLSQRVHDLTVQDLVHSCVLDIVEKWGHVVGELRNDVSGWATTLREDVANLATTIQEIQNRRLESGRIRSRRYVTAPGDDYENRLVNSCLRTDDPNDQTRSAGVVELLSPMSWSWESGLLVLRTPAEDGRSSGTREWRQALPEHTRRCFATFAGIREVTIWQALRDLGHDENSLRQELVGRLSPITNIDLTEQQRVPNVQMVAKNIVVADWLALKSGDGPDSASGLSQGVRRQLGNDAVRWADPHLVLGVGQRHLVKMSSLSCVPDLAREYKPILTGKQPVEGTMRRLPLHLFPGESLAAEIELSAMDNFGSSVVVPSEVIGLLQHEQEMTDFALAVGFGLWTLHMDRRGLDDAGQWQTGEILSEEGSCVRLSLGANLFLACRTFLAPVSPTEKRAVSWTKDELALLIKSIDTDADYARKLRGMIGESLVPEGDTTPAKLREGLNAVMRALIWRQAARLARPR